MSRDWRLRLADIVEYADDAMSFTSGMTYERFAVDVRTQRAVLYSLQVVGEAVKHVPDEVRARAPHVAWREAARFRDRVAHGYADLRLPAVWEVVTTHLPLLREDVAALLSRDELDGHAPA